MFDPLRECVCGESILPLDRHYGYFVVTIAGSFYNAPYYSELKHLPNGSWGDVFSAAFGAVQGWLIFACLSFQGLPQLLQRPLLDTRDIAAADTTGFGDFPLALGGVALESVTQENDLTFLIGKDDVDGIAQFAQGFPGADLLQQVFVFTDHIHQRERRAIGAGVDIVGQGYILAGLALGSKVHQNLILHTAGGVGGEPGTLAGIESGDALD